MSQKTYISLVNGAAFYGMDIRTFRRFVEKEGLRIVPMGNHKLFLLAAELAEAMRRRSK